LLGGGSGSPHHLVTHLFRHLTAQAVFNRFGSAEASDALRHRSASSITHYLGHKEG
jgi:hypothetical protein